jgi:hypothetical protein
MSSDESMASNFDFISTARSTGIMDFHGAESADTPETQNGGNRISGSPDIARLVDCQPVPSTITDRYPAGFSK